MHRQKSVVCQIQRNLEKFIFRVLCKKSVKQKKTIKEKKWGDQKSNTKKERAKKKNEKKKLSNLLRKEIIKINPPLRQTSFRVGLILDSFFKHL